MFTGIIPLQNYQFILYTYLGVTDKIALVMVGVWGTLGTIFCIAGALSFDKLGRRKSLLGSLWVQFLASIAMVICKSWVFLKKVASLTTFQSGLAFKTLATPICSWVASLSDLCSSILSGTHLS
jgi:hypothetical protein